MSDTGAPMLKRKYEVSATDDLGDVHIFRTDDRERADEVADAMREDLDQVDVSEMADAVAGR